ncbi:MAG TPA: SPOR domain-containing protein [Rectinemataceae bacterium]|nr:SPOR domain-containing protein [Rectinemataceae bacterium]
MSAHNSARGSALKGRAAFLVLLIPLCGLSAQAILAQGSGASDSASSQPAAASGSPAAGPGGTAAGSGPAAAQTVQDQAYPGGLAAARSKLAGVSPESLAEAVLTLISRLPPQDALTLMKETVDRVPQPSERAAMLDRAAELSLLLGRFPDAAALFKREAALASDGGAPLLLRAARCELAAGETDTARDMASAVLIASRDPTTAAQARLVGAWALFLAGRVSEAAALAADLITALSDASLRREAEFLAWTAESGPAKTAAARRLTQEFPESPEAHIASGDLSPPPFPYWYFGSIRPTDLKPVAPIPSAPPAATPAPAAAPAAPPAAPPAATASSVSTGSSAGANAGTEATAGAVSRLQVGYFSVESNARSLAAELSAKGFKSGVEVRSPGAGASTRWVVYVESGKDPDATRLKLKDAGYESYPMD